ncbi:homoserine O-acetyltransferase [bacterium]|nr:homoserine O-acetyltransferase [bacterium]
MSIETQFFTCFQSSPLVLESGENLGSIAIAYETYGTLNTAGDNAILLCHALTGDAHAAGQSANDSASVGWWDLFVGPGKAIDTDRYFVVCSNVIGGCKGSTGPCSINPETGVPYGLHFPVITIGDMIRPQYELIKHLGINHLHGVIGGSMGGMQALEWAITYPEMTGSVIAVATTARLSPQALAFDAVARAAIISDPLWNNGFYYGLSKQPDVGLSIARMIGHITYLSDESMALKFGRNLQKKEDYGYDFSTDFQIESYLKHQGEKFVARFDANSYLYLTKAISYFDLPKKYGSLEQAFHSCQSRFLIMSISSDWLYPPKQSKELVSALMKLNKPVSYCDLQSPYGHDAFLINNPDLETILRDFINQ